MDLTEKAIALIQQTAQAAADATMHKLPGDGRTVYMAQNGTLTAFVVPPDNRAHAIRSLNDLIAYANAFPRVEDPGPVVWHSRNAVVLVLDDADRRDRVRFSLTHSERFNVLLKLSCGVVWMRQDEFVRTLRLKLGLDNTAVVAQFRKLTWQVSNEAAGVVQQADVRLGKSITAKVEGVAELPEELNVPVPVYSEAGEREEYIIRCAVEIDTTNQALALVPLPDEMMRVVDLAQASIRKRLAEDLLDVPVYYGEP